MPGYTSKDTDETLFLHLRNGNKEAFNQIFLRYYPVLCAYASQYIDFEDGQEIVQELMIWIWENRENHCPDSDFKNYLFKSVRNKCLTAITRNQLKQKIFSHIDNSLRSQFENPDFYIVEELTKNLDIALKKLPESYRKAFLMNRFQDMTYKEIAAIENISPKTVDYRIQQALKLLRKELKDYLPFILFLNF